MRESGIDQAQALFPLGCPRSGTTFLARLLNSHPRVLMTYETAVFLQLNLRIQFSRNPRRVERIYGKESRQLWADHLEANAKELIESYYRKIAAQETKTELAYWGDKHPHHAQQQCLDFIDGLYPASRYIYIVRDPRDAACSIAEMNRSSFQDSLDIWKRICDPYEEFLERAGERIFAIRYEDLVAERGERAESILEWLGLKWDPAVSEFLDGSRYTDVHVSNSLLRTRKDFARESIGRWEREISTEDVAYARATVGEFLERYRYAP